MTSSSKPCQVLYVLLLITTIFLSQTVFAGNGDNEAAKQAWPMIESDALLVDVRSAEKFAEGHIEGAINIDWDDYPALISAIGEDKQRQVVFYCRSGNRSGKSIIELEARGYRNIYNATGLDALIATRP